MDLLAKLALTVCALTVLPVWPVMADAMTPRTFARTIVGIESYGQGIWYSARLGYRVHRQLVLNGGYSYIEIPPGSSGTTTARFHLVPVSLSALWPLGNENSAFFAEFLFGGTIVIGNDRTERTGVRATATGQPFTPVVGLGAAYLPAHGGITLRTTLYIFQGIDSIGLEPRRLPWLGGSIGYAF